MAWGRRSLEAVKYACGAEYICINVVKNNELSVSVSVSLKSLSYNCRYERANHV